MLDAMIASALKRLLDKHIHFRKRVSVEEQRAQKYDRFLRGRQIAYMVSDYFRATGAYDAVQGLSYLFGLCLHDDDVQDFDTRWDEAQSAAREIPTENVLEGVYKSEITGFRSASHCIGNVCTIKRSKYRTTQLLQIEDNGNTAY